MLLRFIDYWAFVWSTATIVIIAHSVPHQWRMKYNLLHTCRTWHEMTWLFHFMRSMTLCFNAAMPISKSCMQKRAEVETAQNLLALADLVSLAWYYIWNEYCADLTLKVRALLWIVLLAQRNDFSSYSFCFRYCNLQWIFEHLGLHHVKQQHTHYA